VYGFIHPSALDSATTLVLSSSLLFLLEISAAIRMIRLRGNVVRAVLAAKLTLGFFLASLLVTVNAFRAELSCWAPLLYTILMGPLSEFCFVGALQRTVAALLYGSLLGTACAAIIFFVSRYFIWLRIICIFLAFLPISIMRLSNRHALLAIFTAVALGLVLNSSLQLEVLLSSSSSMPVSSSAASLMRQFCISASIAYLVGLLVAVVLFPLPASATLRGALERILNETGSRVSSLATELFRLMTQAESAWRESQQLDPSTGDVRDVTECYFDSEWTPSVTPSIRTPRSGTESCAAGIEHAVSSDFTILDDEDYTILHEEGALFLQERLWELQGLVVFAHREWTYPEALRVVPIADWAQTVLAVREIISRLAGIESLLGRRRRRPGHGLGLALDQLFRHSLIDVMRLWATVATSCHQLALLLADSQWRWYRWISGRKQRISASQHAQATLGDLLETHKMLLIRQSALASGLVGYERYWQQMLAVYRKLGHDEKDELKGSCSSRTAALFAEDVSAAWFSAIMMHRIVDAVQDAYRVALALGPALPRGLSDETDRLQGLAAHGHALFMNIFRDFFAIPWDVVADLIHLGREIRHLGWSGSRAALQTHRWQLIFFFKFYLLCAITLSVVTSIPGKTALRSDWNVIWLYFSVVITARPTTESAVSVGLMRVSGTIIGAVLGFLLMLRPVVATNVYAVTALSIFIIYIFFYLALLDRHKWLQYASRVGILTYTLVVMCQYQGLEFVAQWQYALSRCVMTCAGVLLAVLVVASLSPRMAVRESRQILSRVFSTAAEATGSFHAVYITRDTSTRLPSQLTPAFLLQHYSNFTSLTRSPSLVTLLPVNVQLNSHELSRSTDVERSAEDLGAMSSSTRSASELTVDQAASLLLQRITTDLLAARSAVLPAFGGDTQFTMWRSGLFSAPAYIWRGIDGLWLLLLRLEVIEGVLERPPIYTNRYTGAAVRLFIQPLEAEWRALFEALGVLSEAIQVYLSLFTVWHDLGIGRILPQSLRERCRKTRTRDDPKTKADAKHQPVLLPEAVSAGRIQEHRSRGDVVPIQAVADSSGQVHWLAAGVAEALLLFRKRRSRLWWSLTKRRDRVRRVALSRSMNQQQRQVVDLMGALFLGQEEAERASLGEAFFRSGDQGNSAVKPEKVAIFKLDDERNSAATPKVEAMISTSGVDSAQVSASERHPEASSRVTKIEWRGSDVSSLEQGVSALSDPLAAEPDAHILLPEQEMRPRADAERSLSAAEDVERNANIPHRSPESIIPASVMDNPSVSEEHQSRVSPLIHHVSSSTMKDDISSRSVQPGLRIPLLSETNSESASRHPERVVTIVNDTLGANRAQRRNRSRYRLSPEEEESIVRELTSLVEVADAHRLLLPSMQKPIMASHSVGLPIDDFVHFSSYLFALRETLNSFDFAARMIANVD
jgi:hypothetical protein